MDRHSNEGSLAPTLQQLQSLARLRAKAEHHEKADPKKPHRLQRRFDAQTIGQIVAAYEAGATTPALCDQYGISKGGILRLLRENGATVRRQKLTPEQGEQVVRLYTQGLAIQPIATKLGTSYSNVRMHLIEAGIERHPRGGRYD